MREGRVAASVCFQPKRAEEKSPDDSAYRVGPGLMFPPAWFFHPDVGRGFDDRWDLFFIKGKIMQAGNIAAGFFLIGAFALWGCSAGARSEDASPGPRTGPRRARASA